MKRMILASLISLIASGAYASDLSYGGPYSQMKLKLCSDTPPSRSILPDGSLVCDGEDNDPNAYCVGGFNYADTDIFNCGTEDKNEGDINNNGTPDDEEDWDGDGIPNGVDPDPYKPNQTPNADSNGNNIPDSLDPYVDVLNEVEITRASIQCDNSAECSVLRALNRRLYDTGVTNRKLSNSIVRLVTNGITKGDLRIISSGISRNLRDIKDGQFSLQNNVLNGIAESETNVIRAIGNINVDSSSLDSQFSDIDVQFASVENELDDMEDILWDVKSIASDANSSVKSLPTQINAVHQHMDANKGQLIDAINNVSSGSDGLTSQQKTQLKNAAKASANQKLLKELKTTVATNANQLSDQLAAISGGQSTVDLSGVESSIDALSDKIDGLDGGGNGEELAEISNKLDGLATGVTDIGDLLKGVDASKAGIDGTCIQGDTCQGFYKSAYEGDLSDVVTAQLDAMKTSIVDPFVSSFGNIDLSGAQRPKFGLPVPFYGYMSFDNYIDMDWIFGFLRFIFLASTAFYCRQIIFGG